jgi:chemotaxis protein histidine kinase CheA
MPMNHEDVVKYKSLYLQTSWGYLNMLQKNVGFLLNGVQSENVIESLHLAAHSLKSQSILMGYNQIGQFSGLLEQIFKAAKEKAFVPNNEILELILKGLSNVHLSLSQIAENGTEVDMSETITKIEGVYKN